MVRKARADVLGSRSWLCDFRSRGVRCALSVRVWRHLVRFLYLFRVQKTLGEDDGHLGRLDSFVIGRLFRIRARRLDGYAPHDLSDDGPAFFPDGLQRERG